MDKTNEFIKPSETFPEIPKDRLYNLRGALWKGFSFHELLALGYNQNEIFIAKVLNEWHELSKKNKEDF
jgi:hypothetical protein